MNPIVCIGNYHIDKKIKELMKICHIFELKTPTDDQILTILDKLLNNVPYTLKKGISQFVKGDIRKLETIYNIYKCNPINFCDILSRKIILPNLYNEDTKRITINLINNNFPLIDHTLIMNETDRTIVGLLWHENIIDVLSKIRSDKSIPFYYKILENICFADYIDRITFQKQIWQFNEMSSLIKTLYNNKLYHEEMVDKPTYNPTEVRFTKVLTKYSTEYNNTLFIQNLCQLFDMDKKDLFCFFIELKKKHSMEEIYSSFEDYEIAKLDIDRIYRYLDQYCGCN